MTPSLLLTSAMAEVSALPMGWSVTDFLKNATKTLDGWGALIVSLLGVVLLIAAIWFTATYFLTDQNNPKRKSPMTLIILFIVAGAFMGTGWTLAQSVSGGGGDSIKELGGGLMLLGL